MKHFFANLIAMCFISKKLRRRIRSAIMNKKESPDNTKQSLYEKRLLTLEKQITEKQQNLDSLEQRYNYLKLKAEWLVHNNGLLMIPGRTSEYDLVFCIGATCYGTTILDYFKLRRFSSPFEYTAGIRPDNWETEPNIYRDTRFRQKIQSLCDNFKDWLNPEDFKCVSQWINSDTAHHHVVNTKTKIRYVHEFPSNQDIMQYMPEFMKKTHRRIQNLYNAIDKSQNILILWLANIWQQKTVLEQKVPDKDIKWAVSKLQSLYPDKCFDFVFFEQDGLKKRFEYEKIEVVPGAYRIKSNHFLIDLEYNFVHPVDHQEHEHTHVISEMLDNIHLSKNAFSLPEKTNTI